MQGKSTHTHLKVEPCEAGRCALCSDVKGHVATDRTTADDVRVLHVSHSFPGLDRLGRRERTVPVEVAGASHGQPSGCTGCPLLSLEKENDSHRTSGNVENVNTRKARLKKDGSVVKSLASGSKLPRSLGNLGEEGGKARWVREKATGWKKCLNLSATSACLRHAERRRSHSEDVSLAWVVFGVLAGANDSRSTVLDTLLFRTSLP